VQCKKSVLQAQIISFKVSECRGEQNLAQSPLPVYISYWIQC